MISLSYWAKIHERKAQQIIFICNILLGFLGLFLGQWISYEHVTLSETFRWAGMILVGFGFFFYPIRNFYEKSQKQLYYFTRKSADAFLLIGSFLLFIFIGNHFSEYVVNSGFSPLYASSPTPAASDSFCVPASAPVPLFFQQLAGMSVGVKILLVLALLLVSVALMYLVFGFGCGIACAGLQTAAALFILGGILWLIPFITLGIHHIFGRRPPAPNGLLLRKIIGIVGATGLLLSTIGAFMATSAGVLVLAIILAILFGLSVFYVIHQFRLRTQRTIIRKSK